LPLPFLGAVEVATPSSKPLPLRLLGLALLVLLVLSIWLWLVVVLVVMDQVSQEAAVVVEVQAVLEREPVFL
jgi:hypothetical protein